jgi:hypothetical protein
MQVVTVVLEVGVVVVKAVDPDPMDDEVAGKVSGELI